MYNNMAIRNHVRKEKEDIVTRWKLVVLLLSLAALVTAQIGCSKKSSGGDGDAGTDGAVDQTPEPDPAAQRCTNDRCSGHGVCIEYDNAISCECDPGYAGDNCADCADGYRKELDGSCVPNLSIEVTDAANFCAEIAELVCYNTMECCRTQEIAFLQAMASMGGLFGFGEEIMFTDPVIWETTADCTRDIGLACDSSYAPIFLGIPEPVFVMLAVAAVPAAAAR